MPLISCESCPTRNWWSVSLLSPERWRRNLNDLPLRASVQVFERRPARDASVRRRLLQLESEYQPDAVLTFCGPAYVNFRTPHIMGFADGFVTHPTWRAFQCHRFPFEQSRMLAAIAYKRWWVRKADAWFVQTRTARLGLARNCYIHPKHIAVVPNSSGIQFSEPCRPAMRQKTVHRILVFASYYKHKRLEMIPAVAEEMRRTNAEIQFEFVLTLDPNSDPWRQIMNDATRRRVADCVTTEGVVPYHKALDEVAKSDICFLPTLLETFSSAYPEAMACGKPIVTSDLDFAHEICRDAALYFSPNSSKSAAAALLEVIRNSALAEKLIGKGLETVAALPGSTDQLSLILEQIHLTIERKRNAR